MRERADTLVIRPAEQEDLAEVGELFWATRAAAVPVMPAVVHPHAAVVAFYRGLDLTDGREMWVAERSGRLLAFAELKGDWLDDLYVHPDHQGQGLGSALLEVVKSRRPDGFGLWVFESNRPAQRFYAAHGLVVTLRTDGSENEERAPDLRMEWSRAHLD